MKKMILLVACCGVMSASAQQAKTQLENGRMIFQNNCVRCHGADGTLGRMGAGNLKVSTINDSELADIITNGKWFMPKWRKVLTPGQIAAVATYVKTLRK
ncbi:c-type cytochrome [Pedobacter yulinensis]|nr:c-type cytochrome [Pedobacter yulinensis]